MKKFRTSLPLADFWRPALVASVATALVAAMLLFKIGSLTPGLSEQELQFRSSADSISQIINNPLFIANRLGGLFLFGVDRISPIAMRLVSSVIGLAVVAAMFIILRQWHTTRVSVLATILFASSSWFLSVSRLGTSDSAYLLPVFLLLGGIWLQQKRHVVLASLVMIISGVVLLYVPAMVWFALPALIWQRRRLLQSLRHLSVWWQGFIIVLALVGMLPLAWSLFNNPNLVQNWLGLPQELPTLLEYQKNLAKIPLALFIQREANPVYGIAQLPYVDVFTGVMAAFGAYSYAFRLRLDRTKLILATGLIGAVFIAMGGPVRISMLLPFVYILAAAGIALLLQKWFTVFPRNPFARSVAIVLMSAAIAVTSLYHVNKYFIAWPNVPETKAAFQHHP